MIYTGKLKTKEPKILPNGKLNPKWLKALDKEDELQRFVKGTEEHKFLTSLSKKVPKSEANDWIKHATDMLSGEQQ